MKTTNHMENPIDVRNESYDREAFQAEAQLYAHAGRSSITGGRQLLNWASLRNQDQRPFRRRGKQPALCFKPPKIMTRKLWKGSSEPANM